MILSSPTKFGKSWMLQKCLQEFMDSETSPNVIKLSLNESVNFEMFLYEFEHKLIDTIVDMHPEYQELQDRVTKVFSRFYDDVLIEQQLCSVLEKALDMQKSEQMSHYSGCLDISGKVQEVEQLLHVYRGREYRETPILNQLHELTESIKHNYDNNQRRALMAVLYSLLVEKEHSRKPLEYYS